MRKPIAAFVATLAVLALLPATAPAKGRSLVLCYPGGSVKSRDAKPSTEQMLRLLEKLGGWPANTFGSAFTTDAAECDRLMAPKPDFAIVSLAYYLDHPADGLVPLVQPKIRGKTTDTWRLMVRKGSYGSLEALKGKSLGGSLLSEPRFVDRLVFKGRAVLADFETRPTTQALKALRALNDRELESVLVSDPQFRSLPSLPFAGELEAVFTSDPIPLMGVVADEARTTPDERKRLQKALAGFCEHKEGRQFCELFGIDAFLPANASTYDAMRALWK